MNDEYFAKLTPERQTRILKTASSRTEKVRLIIQDTHHPHNISACLRSAEAFGILHVDVLEINEPFRPSSVAKGTSKWLEIRKWKSIEEYGAFANAKGIALFAAMPAEQSLKLSDIAERACQMPDGKSLAILFGNEASGVDKGWLPYLKGSFTIPILGMVESLNISVAAAISLYTIRFALDQHRPNHTLSKSRTMALIDEWMEKQALK